MTALRRPPGVLAAQTLADGLLVRVSVGRADRHRRIIAPAVGIADTDDDILHLLQCFLLGRRRHPVERLDAAGIRVLVSFPKRVADGVAQALGRRHDRSSVTPIATSPDSKAIITTWNGKLWKTPIDGAAPQEIPFTANVVQAVGPEVRILVDATESW